MLHGRPVAVLGGVRIPFCRQNTAYADVGNLGMSVRTLGALVEKFGLHGQQLGEVAMGAVIKHSSDWNLGREATLSSGLSPLTPGITLQRACGTSLDSIITIGNKIATGPDRGRHRRRIGYDLRRADRVSGNRCAAACCRPRARRRRKTSSPRSRASTCAT